VFPAPLRVPYVYGANGGQVDGDDSDVEFESGDDHDFTYSLGSFLWVEGDEFQKRVEADHAEDDGYAAEGEDGYDTYFGPQGHLESPEGWNGEGEDIEIENDILFY
jgi:hypothetical protein